MYVVGKALISTASVKGDELQSATCRTNKLRPVLGIPPVVLGIRQDRRQGYILGFSKSSEVVLLIVRRQSEPLRQGLLQL